MTATETELYQQSDRQRQNTLLNGMTEAARYLLTIADIDAAVTGALGAIAAATNSDRICIYQHHKHLSTQQPAICCLYTWTKSQITRRGDSRDRVPLDPNVCGDWLGRVEAGEAVQGMTHHRFQPVGNVPERDAAVSQLVVPISLEKHCWGSIWLDDCTTERVWNPAEIAALETVAACIGSAIERDRDRQERDAAARARVAELVQINHGLRDSLLERAKANQAISQTLNTLASKPQLSEFLGQLLLAISDHVGACKSHLFLYDEPSHTLRQFVAVQEGHVYRGNSPIDPDILKHPVPADITAGWSIIMSSDRPFTFDENSPYDNDIWWPGTFEWHQAQGHSAVTCIPMKTGQQPVGYIGFCFRNRPFLSEEQLDFMQALTNQAIVAIQLTRLAERARTTALIDERNRLAREIHDTLAQAFTGVSLQLEAVRGLLTATPQQSAFLAPEDLTEVQTCIRRARDLARTGLSEARRSVHALRSAALETDSLPDALRKVLAQTQQDTGLNAHFYLEGEPVSLPDELELNLLRVSQEAITNTLRHAQATRLDLTLSFTRDRLLLRVVDDGVGFDPAQPEITQSGFGLLGMRERITRFHGTFTLSSTPGIGTTLEASIPINRADTLPTDVEKR